MSTVVDSVAATVPRRRPGLTAVMLTACALLLPAPVSAQALATSGEEFLLAAVTVLTFDWFMADCPATELTAADAAEIDTWITANEVRAIRAQVAAAAGGEELADVMHQMEAELAQFGIPPCVGALAVTRTPEADFAVSAPGVLAALRAGVSVEEPSPAGPAGGSGAQGRFGQQPGGQGAGQQAGLPGSGQQAAAAADVAALAAQIDSFGFDLSWYFGAGGFMAMDVYPVVLFRSGDALKDIELLAGVTSVEAARQANPDGWTQWRRSGNEIELRTGDGWEALPFTATYSTLPPGFRLDGRYLSLGGGGDIAFGGSTSIAAWTEYTFLPDGTVIRGRGSGASSEFADTSVVVASLPPDQRGRYEIDGLVLMLSYDDGSVGSHIIVTDPGDPDGVIWLDGTSYVKR